MHAILEQNNRFDLLFQIYAIQKSNSVLDPLAAI